MRETFPLPAPIPPPRFWAAAACLAIAAPTLLAFNLPPSATFLNQAAALVGWGVFLFCMATQMARGEGLRGAATALPLTAALCLALLAALAAPAWTGLPWSLSLSSAGTLAAAALAACGGAALLRGGFGLAAFRAVFIALLLAGIASTAIALVQVFVPSLADGTLIARSSIPGRAVGNLRQPNHLSSLLLWSIVAVVWLAQTGWLRRAFAIALAALLLFGVVLSGSRTGAVGALVLAVWGLVDRRLDRRWRGVLLAAPVVYAAMWAAMAGWARWHGQVAGVEAHFSAANGDISSSRFAIWSNTLELIRAQPWTGVGFGEFNFAWSLTPFPQRPVAFFDHTHNLVLQLAVELGLPLAALVLGLLVWALLRAGMAAWRAEGREPAEAAALRAGFVMVVMVGLHSQLEYPLWYLYFLLPTVFVWGLCLGAAATPSLSSVPASADEGTASPAPSSPRLNAIALGAVAIWLGGLLAVLDYARVVVIFAPPDGAAPLAQRIAEGQRSVLFSHHADYAAATTTAAPGAAPMDGFRGAPHYLLDARLQEAWAKALAQAGDTERARHVAQRLKEFRNEQSQSFFDACDDFPAHGSAAPFQCQPPKARFGHRDFR